MPPAEDDNSSDVAEVAALLRTPAAAPQPGPSQLALDAQDIKPTGLQQDKDIDDMEVCARVSRSE